MVLLIPGTKAEGAFGCAALPNLENEFRDNFQKTLEYAKALNCNKYWNLYILSKNQI